jgi:pimeloyl-ACP methyl ester carboxylesterase
MRQLLPCALLVAVTGCVTVPNTHPSYKPPAIPDAAPAGVVFVANGAGDFGTVSQNLIRVVRKARVPLQVETVSWSLGYRRYVADQVNHDNHLEQGRLLAVQVAGYRQACPQGRVYLVGHSAGCAVVLAAAESLPPDSVDRIILLSPSCCSAADLRGALRASRCGIDNFYSERDRMILGLGMRIVGTTERACRTAAGQTGFVPVISSPEDAALYSRLQQHPWNQTLEWSGHDGGHFGNNQPAFLRAYVLPLID